MRYSVDVGVPEDYRHARADHARLDGSPRGPKGQAAAHVFTFADAFTVTLCHLARTVEAAGGWLHVLGIKDGMEMELPWKMARGSETQEDEPWHFADKAVMLKKHVFLFKAIRNVPRNTTVVFVDAFDVLFQRPLADLVASYHRMARPVFDATGFWPVVFGGERNCWPFPHGGSFELQRSDGTWFEHIIKPDASLSADHNGHLRYPYSARGPWGILGSEVCGEWLARRGGGEMPFLCAGTFVGEASGLRRLLLRMFRLVEATGEYHDQALAAILLLQDSSLGMVDQAAEIFLGLHGHDERMDLDRPLCGGTRGAPHFKKHGRVGNTPQHTAVGAQPRACRRAAGNAFCSNYEDALAREIADVQACMGACRHDAHCSGGYHWTRPDGIGTCYLYGVVGAYAEFCVDRVANEEGDGTATIFACSAGVLPPVPSFELVNFDFAEWSVPIFKDGSGRFSEEPAALLHFNGNGKRHMHRCIDEFRDAGVLGGEDLDSAECTFFDQDRGAWSRYR